MEQFKQILRIYKIPLMFLVVAFLVLVFFSRSSSAEVYTQFPDTVKKLTPGQIENIDNMISENGFTDAKFLYVPHQNRFVLVFSKNDRLLFKAGTKSNDDPQWSLTYTENGSPAYRSYTNASSDSLSTISAPNENGGFTFAWNHMDYGSYGNYDFRRSDEVEIVDYMVNGVIGVEPEPEEPGTPPSEDDGDYRDDVEPVVPGTPPDNWGGEDSFTPDNQLPSDLTMFEVQFNKLALSRYYELGQNKNVFLFRFNPPSNINYDDFGTDLTQAQIEMLHSRYLIIEEGENFRFFVDESKNAWKTHRIYYFNDELREGQAKGRLYSFNDNFDLEFNYQGKNEVISNYRKRTDNYENFPLELPTYEFLNKHDYTMRLISVNGNYVKPVGSEDDKDDGSLEGSFPSFEEWLAMENASMTLAREQMTRKFEPIVAVFDGFKDLSEFSPSGRRLNLDWYGVNIIPYDFLETNVNTFMGNQSIMDLVKSLMRLALWVMFFIWVMNRFRPQLTTGG